SLSQEAERLGQLVASFRTRIMAERPSHMADPAPLRRHVAGGRIRSDAPRSAGFARAVGDDWREF
ncbi:hypothetical protein, partial [Escherichia coli]|uniref:hypothetical protein n=1 Tax=Escherichia coli TaxID=562 RepID=UPI003CE599FF